MFKLRSHVMSDYVVGRNSAGLQIMIGLLYPYVCCLLFDEHGRFVEARLRPLSVLARSSPSGPAIEDPGFRETYELQMSSWQSELHFVEQPIAIEKFAIRRLGVGVEDLPRHLVDFESSPEEFSDEEQREYPLIIDRWRSEGNYVLWWGTDYYVDKAGSTI